MQGRSQLYRGIELNNNTIHNVNNIFFLQLNKNLPSTENSKLFCDVMEQKLLTILIC